MLIYYSRGLWYAANNFKKGIMIISLEQLVQDISDDKAINLTRGVCSIAHTLIADMPLKVDGYAHPISRVNYTQMVIGKPVYHQL